LTAAAPNRNSEQAMSNRRTSMLRWAAFVTLLSATALVSSAHAADNSKCSAKVFLLWGDGQHDDTAGLNAWFRGDTVLWGKSGGVVGPRIADHSFLLTGVLYIPSGTGRTIEHFRLFWPARKEIVAGGTIASGDDSNRPAVTANLTKVGVGPGEGEPFPILKPKPAAAGDRSDCLVS
jgi:hypothetical protein